MSSSIMASNGDQQPSSVTIESWLKDLRMECYRRNLETYTTFQSILFVKDAELKKLGIQNARDRKRMIDSLTSFSPSKSLQGFGSKTVKESSNESQSLSKKGKPMRKLKGLLGAGNVLQRKGKKSSEVMITSPKMSFDESKGTCDELSQSVPVNRLSVSLEDLIMGLKDQQHHTIENDYVPDPQGSPQFVHIPLQRSYTISEPQCSSNKDRHVPPTTGRPSTVNYDEYPFSQHHNKTLPVITDENINEFDHLSPKEDTGNDNFSFEERDYDSSKHLSVVSMESGLGLTCESDDNFNPSIVLEEQPWYHGNISRKSAESLLDEDGDFLVHENRTTDAEYTLSLVWDGRCYHVLINCDEVVMKGLQGGGVTVGYKYQFENGAFDSIPELIFNHLRYQIPISRDIEAVIRHPIGKTGSKLSSYSSTDNLNHKNRTLPKNFSYVIRKSRVMSPDFPSDRNRSNTLVRSTRSASFSPADSPRGSPIRDVGKRPTSGSNSNLLGLINDIQDEDEASDMVLKTIYRDVPDSPVTSTTKLQVSQSTPIREEEVTTKPRTIVPYNTYDIPVPSINAMRPRGKTEGSRQNQPPSYFLSTSTLSDSSDYQHPRPYDPDDYEEMRSVSVFDTLPSSPAFSPKASPKLSHKPFLNMPSDSSNQYGFLTPRSCLASPPVGPQPGVKYAEVTFKRSNTVSSDYHINSVVHGKQPKVTYVTTKTIRDEVGNIGDHYAHPLRKQPSLDRSFSSSSTPYKSKRQLPRQSSMDLLRPGKSVNILSRHTKCPQSIQEVPSFLKDFSNDELAMHLTKADGVCFLLTPRPAENAELWTNRVQEVMADGGVFVGLQILASSTGVKLWKKLFHRHLSISQLVILCILQVIDPVERAKMLKKWIELCQLLQNGTYGNLFSFMAIMKGLESPQVSDLTRTWELLKIHFSDVYDIYHDQLKGMISALMQGASVYSIEDLTIPAIQHLRKLYSEETTTTSGGVQCVLEDFTTRVTGLDGLRNIIRHTSDLSANARKRLSSYSFDTLLFDFFMQDVARMHLQNIGTFSDDPLERYRRFNIVLDSIFHKIDIP